MHTIRLILFELAILQMTCNVILDSKNTNVTVDADLKLKIVYLVIDKNLCHIRGVDIQVGNEKIIKVEQDAIRKGKELHQLKNSKEEDFNYEVILLGDDGGNVTFSYVYKTDGEICY